MEQGKKRITLAGTAETELEEKRSRFIGYAAPVQDEKEAQALIAQRKAMYKDATHNVWAYYIDGGTHARYSDDGEPQGTAGIPVLNVLKMSGATDLCVVVTRYFGGTLLGAGGLVRAYSASAKQALDAAGFAYMEEFSVLKICCGYSEYQKINMQLAGLGAMQDAADFGSNVEITAAIETGRVALVEEMVREVSAGRGSVALLRTEERASQGTIDE